MQKPQSGIYMIQSLIKPDRFYIGSAVNVKKRWQRHIQELLKKKHSNKFLQSHFDKYGRDDFMFELLHICEKENLIKMEQEFIDNLQPPFNLLPTAGSKFGFIIPFATRAKIKRSWKLRSPISMQSRLYKTRYGLT